MSRLPGTATSTTTSTYDLADVVPRRGITKFPLKSLALVGTDGEACNTLGTKRHRSKKSGRSKKKCQFYDTLADRHRPGKAPLSLSIMASLWLSTRVRRYAQWLAYQATGHYYAKCYTLNARRKQCVCYFRTCSAKTYVTINLGLRYHETERNISGVHGLRRTPACLRTGY